MLKIDRIALISNVSGLDTEELTRVASAIQNQIIKDFTPEWHLSASIEVGYAPMPGVVPIYIVGQNLGGLAGFHRMANGWPYAVVRFGPTWSVAASHEALELIVDPTGDRTVIGSWREGPCNYVVEVCDPCQLINYQSEGQLVSDFCLPAYYDQSPPSGARLTRCNSINTPKHVLAGGTLAWITQNNLVMQVAADLSGGAQISTVGPYAPGILGAREQLGAMDQTYTGLSHLKLSVEQRAALRTARRSFAAIQRTTAKMFDDELQRHLQTRNLQSVQGERDAKPNSNSDVRSRPRRVRRAKSSVRTEPERPG